MDNLAAIITRPDQIKQLRQTILNLAVQGRLVPQDPKEEPASELLKRLILEVRSYANQRAREAPEPEPLRPDEILFPAPIGWAWTRLSQIFKIITDGDHQPPPKADGGVPFLTIGNITTGRLDFSDCRFVLQSYYHSLPAYRTPKRGDILYTVVGATYGRPALVDTARSFCVQRHIAILKPTSEMHLPFLIPLLASPLVYEQASRSTTGTAQPTIGLAPLRNFIVPVPPLAEQRRIVAKLGELMAVCDRLEGSLAAGDDSRRRLLDALLAEALEPDGCNVIEEPLKVFAHA